MNKAAASSLPPVMREILHWSTSKLSLWQRDALRRLTINGFVSDDGISELALACLSDNEALNDGESAPKLMPLSAEHIATSKHQDGDVSIESISNVECVNALAKGQIVRFRNDGLTVVFGDNAAGKSSYARILKHSCRARRRDEFIRSNVYEAKPKNPASAQLKCLIGGKTETIDWQDGSFPEELKSVTCFDSDCAVVQIRDPSSIYFTPFGLDLFPKLVDVCKRVKEVISDRAKTVAGTQLPKFAELELGVSTKVGKLVRNLERATKDQLTKQSHFSTTDDDRIRHLEKLLAADPEKQVRVIVQKTSRFRKLQTSIQKLENAFGEEAIKSLYDLHEEARSKREAAKLAAEQLAGNTPVPSVGSNPWKQLWEAARKYSQLAYPESSFPVTQEAHCLLCQQKIGDEASLRLKGFEAFVKDETESAAVEAQKQFETAIEDLSGHDTKIDSYETVLEELSGTDEKLAIAIRSVVSSADALRQELLSEKCAKPTQVPGIDLENSQLLDGIIQIFEAEEKSVKKLVDEDERATIEAELAELIDRKWLSENLDDCIEEKNRLELTTRLKRAEKDTGSSSITMQGGKLTKKHVTEKLTSAFQSEVKTLCNRDIKVSLGKGPGRGGVATYKISLDAKQDARPDDVLSEGEQRCIALAGFLAELATCENRSTIVFDDPVSSLGHKWRSRFAARLANEAAHRQVIVFTHDMCFVDELLRRCRNEEVPHKLCHVKRSGDETGVYRDGLPWLGAHTLDRIKIMRDRLEDYRPDYSSFEEARQLEITQKYFAQLRETVERTVEREFIGGCIHRFQNYIPVSKLWKATAFNLKDAEELHKISIRCSGEIEGHDRAESAAKVPAAIDEMVSLLDQLETLIKDVSRKRENIERNKFKKTPAKKQTFIADY